MNNVVMNQEHCPLSMGLDKDRSNAFTGLPVWEQGNKQSVDKLSVDGGVWLETSNSRLHACR